MSVTLMVCAERECGRMLNGEVCDFVGGNAYCWEHTAAVRVFSAARRAIEDARKQSAHVRRITAYTIKIQPL